MPISRSLKKLFSATLGDFSEFRRKRFGAEHASEIASFFEESENAAMETLLAFGDENKPLGFAELSIRNYAEGCATERVAYLEGWYVEPHARK